MTEIFENELERRLTELEGARNWSPRLVSKLEMLIRTGEDSELFRINPVRYAEDSGSEESETIDLFLHGAACGLFDMEWLIVCATCAHVANSFRRLATIDPHFTCNMCSAVNEADMDDHIQVAFTVSPEVRSIAFHDLLLLEVEDLYSRYSFSTEAMPLANGQTIVEQFRDLTKWLTYVEPGESKSVEVEVAGTMLGVFDLLNSTNAKFVVPDAEEMRETRLGIEIADAKMHVATGSVAQFELDLPVGEWSFEEGPSGTGLAAKATAGRAERSVGVSVAALGSLPAGTITVEVTNRGPGRAAVWVVRYTEVPEAVALVEFIPLLSAKRLLSTQTFRQLFRSETAAGTESLQVRDLTYLFTDLTESTAMYDTIGDANAYNLVRLHFDTLVTIIADNSGAVVKTIGDAVMATFVDPADAVRAALAGLEAMKNFNRTNSSELVLKIGIHRGHSIAVTLNDQIDYFGQSVNIAARVQQVAGPGELVLTADVYGRPEVQVLLEGFEVTATSAIVKGVAESVALYKVRPEPVQRETPASVAE